MPNKKILAFTGLIASGKGTAAKYFIEKHKAVSFRFSTSMRDVLDRLYLEQSRKNMAEISLVLREAFGQNLFSKVIANDAAKSESELVVIDGVRRSYDLEALKKIEGFQLIGVEVDSKIRSAFSPRFFIRFERLKKRGENADDISKTWEQFQADHKLETEVYIPELLKQADVTIDNNGSLEDLYKQLDKLVE